MPPTKRAKRGAAEPQPFTLQYFGVAAKGLGPALVAEFSGLPWKGNKDAPFVWAELKAATPFGQLPLLTTADGMQIAQTTAIVNYIAKIAGTEGADLKDFATSQMLIAEGEDLYSMMQKFLPTINAKLGSTPFKGGPADYTSFWADKLPAQLEKLETMLCAAGASSSKFTATGDSAGELYLFSMLHQLVLVDPKLFVASGGKQPSALAAFYARLKADQRTQAVLSGDSTMGPLKQYFVSPEGLTVTAE